MQTHDARACLTSSSFSSISTRSHLRHIDVFVELQPGRHLNLLPHNMIHDALEGVVVQHFRSKLFVSNRQRTLHMNIACNILGPQNLMQVPE